MKLSFNFDRDSRSFRMEPEDVLETTLMEHLTELCEKGASLKIRKITHESKQTSFSVEMKVRPTKENGDTRIITASPLWNGPAER